MHVLFFRKVCQLIPLMKVKFNGIINGLVIFALHKRIFRVKKSRSHRWANTSGLETCTGDPRLPHEELLFWSCSSSGVCN